MLNNIYSDRTETPHRGQQRGRSLTILVAAVAMLFAGCGGGNKQKSKTFQYPVEVSVVTPKGEAIPGVPVKVNGTLVGKTDREGRFSAKYRGKRGSRLKLDLDRIEGYRFQQKASLKTELRVKKRVTDGKLTGVPVELRVKAESLINDYLVWVHLDCEKIESDACGGIPITLDGEAMGTTRPDGIGHFIVEKAPGSSVKIGLNLNNKEVLYEEQLGLESEILQINYAGGADGEASEAEPEPEPAPEPERQPDPQPEPEPEPERQPEPEPEPEPEPDPAPKADSDPSPSPIGGDADKSKKSSGGDDKNSDKEGKEAIDLF